MICWNCRKDVPESALTVYEKSKVSGYCPFCNAWLASS